ncbi:microtubule-associated protein [Lojkania enalia]|uniref:Ribosome biogenesis protein YTM1 n=1 Tax=Lojkania enalia TaxID=147567 RepID=A0A9P4MW61_9PLEO|nr:microtubule-associated protein [Didymosphaeria enalia]
MASNTKPPETKVQIRLSTRHLDLKFSEDPGAVLVPTSLRRLQLSRLVNSFLQTSTPLPFDFLINGQFLRSSIDDFLTQNGISAEITLNVEYTPALVPPVHVASFEHDDWVSGVDILSQGSPAGTWGASIPSGQERIVSSSYDGLIRVWDLSGNCLAVSAPPNNGSRISSLKCVNWLNDKTIVAAGMDSVVRVFDYDADARTITQSLELYNHKWPVENLAVHAPSDRILAASADTTISLFAAAAKDSPAAPDHLLPSSTTASNKRRKKSNDGKTVPSRGAHRTLTGHTSAVSEAIFKPGDATVAYSASRDHTLRTWDLTTANCVDMRTTAHPLLCLTALPTPNLLATGTSARHITLADPRADATQIAAMTLRGHMNAVVSLDQDPSSEYGLVSGSHDGTIRIWDVRSVKPGGAVGEGQVGESVYVIERDGAKMKSSGEGVKVFSVRWEAETGIVSCGEDKKVQINKGESR